MGFFARLFGTQPKQQGPASVSRNGYQVIQVTDTFSVTGRGVVVIGEVLTPITVDEWLDVDHAGTRKSLRLSQIKIDDETVPSAAPGTKVAALLTSTSIGTWLPT